MHKRLLPKEFKVILSRIFDNGIKMFHNIVARPTEPFFLVFIILFINKKKNPIESK